jgi:predicted SnoaL-like aldol condensation-catalyzing enzyme
MTGKASQNKAVVVEALTKAYLNRDFTALERWFSPAYIQHNPYIPATRAGLRSFIESLPAGRSYEHGMVVAEGDLVMVHGRYSGGGRKTFIAVDIFRFEDGRVVEHWDVLQEEVPAEKTVAGNPMFSGPPTHVP